jgi:tetratricopeptide (TPR) repeat protein
MARAAVKAKQAQRAKAQPAKATQRRARGRRGHSGGGNPNQQLFFVRMRRHAKFMYVLLAILFAATFAFLGVGSGSSGLQDLFSGLNLFGGGHGASLSKALNEVKKHPTDPKSFRDLATAYEAKSDTANAITALEQYTTLRPKSPKIWSELAGLQLQQAQNYQQDYANAYQSKQLAAPSTSFLPSGKLGTAVGTSPIETAAADQVNTQLNDAYTNMTGAYSNAISSLQHVTKLNKADAGAQFQLAQAAQTAYSVTGSSTYAQTAIGAYKAYLKLNPGSTSAAQIRQLIKQLSPAPAPAPAPKKKK